VKTIGGCAEELSGGGVIRRGRDDDDGGEGRTQARPCETGC